MRLIFRAFFIFMVPLYGIGTQMLIIPSSAEELSIGSHSTLPGMLPINPALYSSRNESPEILLNRGTWLGGISLTQIGYNQKFGEKVFHLGLKYSGVADLEFRENIPKDISYANFSAYGLIIDSGFGFQLKKHRFGISFSYIHFGLYTAESKGVGIDFGYFIDIKNGYSAGLVAKNIGKMNKLNLESPRLPKRFSIGLSKHIEYDSINNTVFASLDWNSVVTSSKFYFGNRLNWNRLYILAGYSSSKEVRESSFGIGLNFNRFKITYGTRMGSQDLGFPKILSFEFLLP